MRVPGTSIIVGVDAIVHHPARDGSQEDDGQGWMGGVLAGKGSSAAVAFLCTKALSPFRAGVTFTATPLLHRYAHRVVLLHVVTLMTVPMCTTRAQVVYGTSSTADRCGDARIEKTFIMTHS